MVKRLIEFSRSRNLLQKYHLPIRIGVARNKIDWANSTPDLPAIVFSERVFARHPILVPVWEEIVAHEFAHILSPS